MMNGRAYPFLILSLFYVVGLLLASWLGDWLWAKILFDFLILSTVAAWWTAIQPFHYRLRSIFTVWAWLSMLLLGAWRYASVAEDTRSAVQFMQPYTGHHLSVQVMVEEVKARPGKWQVMGRLLCVADSVETGNLRRPMRLLLYVEERAVGLQAGDCVYGLTQLQEIPDNPNPLLFNYASFLRQKGVYFQGFLSAAHWQKLDGAKAGIHRQRYLFRLQALCMRRLKQALPEPDRLAVGAALIIGNREQLDRSVRELFSRTGAMHILAVSGLHVGLIAWLLGWVMGRVPSMSSRWRIGVQISGVWGYVLLCGAGASVVRAGVMFSWMALGKELNRPVDIWNALSGSALFLLIYDPGWLLDMGFQLSYLAVAGIVLFQSQLAGCWELNNRLGNYFWSLTTVGIAAQIVTSPLTIYQFHQFPFAFLPSGWVAVPLGAVVQVLGVGVLLAGDVPVLGDVLGFLLGHAIGVMLTALRWMADIPGQCVEGIWMDTWSVVWLFLLVGVLASFRGLNPEKWKVWLFLGCLLAGGLGRVYAIGLRAEKQWLICYGVRGATRLECWNGSQVAVWSKGSEENIARATEGIYLKFRPTRVFRWPEESPDWADCVESRIWAQGLRIFVWDGEDKSIRLPDADADYWLLRGNPFIPKEEMLERRPLCGLLIDGSNAPLKVNYYTKWAAARGIPVWNIMEQGAWIHPLTR